MKRQEGEGLMGEVIKLEVPGVRPRVRPKKQWKNDVEEDLREMNLTEPDAMDRDGWLAAIKSSNRVTWRRRR